MYKFPARSWQSDQHARYVKEAIDRTNAGENFMVSVVTTQSVHVYVALSGSTRTNVERKLEQELSFGKSLQGDYKLTGSQKKKFDRLKRSGDQNARQALELDKAVRKLDRRLGGVYKVVTQLSQMNRSMTDPDRPSVKVRIKAYEEMIKKENFGHSPYKPAMGPSLQPTSNPLNYPNSRDCAEPKVLQAVYGIGERVTGMTTIWYGSQPNPYPDPARLPDLNLAIPCEFCRMNEQRIMIHLTMR